MNTVGVNKRPCLWTDLMNAVLWCQAALQLWYEQVSGGAMRAESESLIQLRSAGTPTENTTVWSRQFSCDCRRWTNGSDSRGARLITLYLTKCNNMGWKGNESWEDHWILKIEKSHHLRRVKVISNLWSGKISCDDLYQNWILEKSQRDILKPEIIKH